MSRTETQSSGPPRIGRREVIALGVGAFLVATLPRGLRRAHTLVRRRIPLMGTIAEVAVVHSDRAMAHTAIAAAFSALRETDALMSHYRRDSDVGRANAGAARGPVRVSPETAYVLERALAWARKTGGAFDPCLGRAVRLWDVKRRRSPPAKARVRALAGRDLWQALDLDLDDRGGVVRFRDAGVALDLGGIAKGHGVDRAAAALRAHGIEDGLVNVGGDLRALGVSEDGDPWRVGVRDPADPTRIHRTLQVRDLAVATSGDYRQYFDHGGGRYHHLLDPRTAAPRAAAAHSLTITAETCLTADAAATASFGDDDAGVRALLRDAAPDAHMA